MLVISTQNFPPEIGGIANLVYDLSLSLAKFTDPLVVFADHKSGFEIKSFDRAQSYDIYRYSGLKPLRRRRKAHRIHRLVNENPGGTSRLIADSWKSLEYIRAELFTRVICLVHGTEIPRDCSSRKANRIRAALSKADFIVANSKYTAGILSPFVNDASKIRIIHPGLTIPRRDKELEQRIASRFSAYSPVITTVARLEKRKGQQQVIQLIPVLLNHFPDLLYVMIGTGSELGHLQRMASRLELERHVLFAGSLTGTEKNAYLVNSDLFVMPGSIVGQDVEGFGMAYIEAGYFSIPSIATRSGGAPEAVIHEKTGLVSEVDDPEQLRVNIMRLLQDNELRQRLGENAASWSRELLWENQVLNYRDLLYGS